MIAIRSFSYSYPFATAPALRDITLDVEAGAFVGVIGPNGAGKSTLCAALAGFVPRLFRGQFAGSVMVDGIEMTAATAAQTAGRAGIVMQNAIHQLSGVKHSVREEIAFGLENMGVPRDEMRARVDDAIARLGLAELAHRPPFTLSGGQQQRVAIASLVAMRPSVLIMDEPTSQLDPVGSREVLGMAAALRATGITVIVAEHKLEWLAQHADRLIVLHEGKVALAGTPREVLTSDALAGLGLRGLRYTLAARMARAQGAWPASRALPISLDEARAGFEAGHAG